MNRLKFTKDQGLTFYKELNERIDEYFKVNGRERTGNGKMYFKIIMYFSLDFLFYFLMINSTSLVMFYVCYLLMGLFVLMTAFNVSHDAAHGVAAPGRAHADALDSHGQRRACVGSL
jgi:linoleoyl-CoA desaturase